jgi:aldehyde:ferredoxin oxidoreductase
MSFGYNNKILMVNLTTGEIGVEEPGDKFYRMYLGGSGIGAYYCMRDIPKGADPLGPDNVLVFAAGVVTGAPVMASSRIAVSAKSPESGAIGDSQGGGWFGNTLKYAGYDAVIVKGKAEKPVYLFVQDGKAEIRDAGHLWGMTTKDYEAKLRAEISRDVFVCGIGPAGENQFLYSCILNERKHANGRSGMGAVMGSKNLKCVAAIGKKAPYEYADPEILQKNVRYAAEWAKTSPQFARMNTFGTSGGAVNNNSLGMLPTKNFTEGYFEPTDRTLSGVLMKETIVISHERCYMCNIACKSQVKATKEKDGWDVDEAYGGPEYETIAMFGGDCMIDDIVTVAKCNEICNAYGMDTIATGALIAFAMECYENGLLTKEQCYGHELKFGNREATVDLLMKLATRDGWLANVLADGLDAAAKAFGGNAEYFKASVKNHPYPAHMPQGKKNLAVHYAINEFGPDHCNIAHDPGYDVGGFQGPAAISNYVMGIYEPVPYRKLVEGKMKLNYYMHLQRTILNSICVCQFGYGPGSLYDTNRTVDIINGATGWQTNYWEMMKSAERIVNLMRMFNQREGFGAKDDVLPKRMFEQKFTVGPLEGEYVDEKEFYQMRDLYYDMAGQDAEGHPRHSKVVELDLGWAEELVKKA